MMAIKTYSNCGSNRSPEVHDTVRFTAMNKYYYFKVIKVEEVTSAFYIFYSITAMCAGTYGDSYRYRSIYRFYAEDVSVSYNKNLCEQIEMFKVGYYHYIL